MDTPFTATALTASLTVNDLQASIAWYRDALGFTVGTPYEREGKMVAAPLSAGDVRILLNQEDGKKGKDRVKGQGFSLSFMTAMSVDDIAARFTAHGGTLTSGPADMPWGVRMIRFTDPDGFLMTIQQPLK